MKPRHHLTTELTPNAIRYYSLLALTYAVLVFVLPANKATMRLYHVSSLEYHILLFAIALPSLIVWFAAFYSYSRLQQYARTIADSPEGKDFNGLANGSAWLAWSLPIPTIISLILNAIANAHPAFHPTAIIITDYLSLVLPLIAFSVIGVAARGLVQHAKIHLSMASARSVILIFVTAGVAYCFLTFQHLDLTSIGSTNNPYYLPAWLMVLSIIIPYLYAWFVGLLAAYEIKSFSKNVHGLLYKQPLRLLASGLLAVIISSIALQYISSVEPRLGHVVLDYKLVLTSLFRIIGGVGYLLIAVGANRLKKIEDV